MLVLKGDIDKRSSEEIQKVLGEKIGLKAQLNFNTTGSNLYHLVQVVSNDKKFQDIFDESRCNFEKYPKGFLLWINKSQEITRIAIPFAELIDFELIQGIENTIKKKNILNLILWAFRIPHHKIKIIPYWWMVYKSKAPAHLKLKTKDLEMTLKTHGFNYASEKKYFQSILSNLKIH